MSANVMKSYSVVDEGMAIIHAAHGHEIACAAGCFWCCKEPVSAEEAEVRHALSTFFPEQIEALRPKAQQWLDTATASGLLAVKEPNVTAYRAANLWCPLLDAAGRCSVYAHRPLACRMHLARHTNAGCRDDALRKSQIFLTSPQLLELSVLAALDETGGVFITDHFGAWLARIVLGVAVESAAMTRYEVDVDDGPAAPLPGQG